MRNIVRYFVYDNRKNTLEISPSPKDKGQSTIQDNFCFYLILKGCTWMIRRWCLFFDSCLGNLLTMAESTGMPQYQLRLHS